MALNGRPAIFQMARLVEEIRTRGGDARQLPAAYLQEYDDRLLRVVNERVRADSGGPQSRPSAGPSPAVTTCSTTCAGAGSETVPCQRHASAIRPLRSRLAEADPFFGNEIHAPDGDDTTFSKRGVIERILCENGSRGEELLSFGDGVVETEEVRRVGGTAVAVASDESRATVNVWKRDRLVPAGADVVIRYRNHDGCCRGCSTRICRVARLALFDHGTGFASLPTLQD